MSRYLIFQLNAFISKFRYVYVSTLSIYLLIDREADLNLWDIDGWTPLMIAAEKGHSKVVNLLVEAGALMDTQDKDDKTFFHIAAAAGHPHIIKVIF